MSVIERTCLVCGRKLKIAVRKDKTYTGGHYFGKLSEKDEYWECENCCNKD